MKKLISTNMASLFVLAMTVSQMTPFLDTAVKNTEEEAKGLKAGFSDGEYKGILDNVDFTKEDLGGLISLPGLGPVISDLENVRNAARCL